MKLPKLTAEMGLCPCPGGRDNQTNRAASINFRSIPFTSGITLSNVGDCTDQQHAQLQAQVNYYCHGALGCNNGLPCNELWNRMNRLAACTQARIAINNTCFRGGDVGHQTAADNASLGVERCSDIYVWESGCLDY